MVNSEKPTDFLLIDMIVQNLYNWPTNYHAPLVSDIDAQLPHHNNHYISDAWGPSFDDKLVNNPHYLINDLYFKVVERFANQLSYDATEGNVVVSN